MDAPAGWYPDPREPGRIRWWDGAGWTEHTGAQPTEHADTALAEPVRRSPVLPVVAGVVVLLLLAVGAVTVLLSQRGSGGASGPQAGAASPSGTPAPSAGGPTPETTGSGAPSGTPAPASTQGGALGTTLETFRPADGFLAPTLGTELIEGGDTTDDPTLDGWCSQDYVTEKNRLARRQWRLTLGGEPTGWSVETVAYGSEAEARAALAEFVARTRACRDVTFTDQGVEQTQNLVSTPKLTPITGVAGAEGRITIDFVQDGQTTRLNNIGLVQQAGRYLSVVWAGQTTFTEADLAVLDQLREQQAEALHAAAG